MSDALLKWLPCRACQKRAVVTKENGSVQKEAPGKSFLQMVSDLGKKSVPLCPTSCIGEECFFCKANAKSGRRPICDELTKVEKVLQRGRELFATEQFTYAELSYDKAIELDPVDWRGYYGKTVMLQRQGKAFKGFQACRRGVEKLPECPIMREIEASARDEYQRSKAAGIVAPVAPACPISGDGSMEMNITPRVFTGRIPTKEDRTLRKEMILNVFREQWQRLGKAKETMGYADYSQDQKKMLQIEGGHRPMPRPDGIEMPKDFQQPIGVVTSAHLVENYNCNCERLLLSIHGDIFDVSDRPDKYGKKGPYYYFAGCDITWGLVTGNDTDQIVNMFFDLFKMDDAELSKKMQCICSWEGFYEVEYGKPVGRLKEFEDEMELPAPPMVKDAECVVQ